MAQDARGKQTRGDILQTAARLFSIHGYFHTSTSDIIGAVSVSKGAFYHHFKSKEDLAMAIMGQLRSDYQQLVIEPVNSAGPGERPREMFRRIVALNESGQWCNCLLLVRLAGEMAQQEGDLSERIREIVNWLLDFWEEIISDAQKVGAVSERFDARRLAELIFSTLAGAISYRELDEEVGRLSEIAEYLQAMITA
jgi:AcrR family transcriptional regulator